ncbi:MAG: hypothetical protein LBU34_07410 [Planctomycetaceae bacterium]|nr:hypothetical protein [Planctomycetaceae bacterium]
MKAPRLRVASASADLRICGRGEKSFAPTLRRWVKTLRRKIAYLLPENFRRLCTLHPLRG